MKTKFDWKTSRAAFSTFKKLLYLSAMMYRQGNNNEPGRDVPHEELVKFAKLNRSVISEHIQGFADADIVSISFKGRDKTYKINYKILGGKLKKMSKEFIGVEDFSVNLLSLMAISDTFEELIRFGNDEY